MTKFYTLLSAALLGCGTVAAQTVFTEDFATQSAFDRWTYVDANNDEKTWTYDATGDTYKVYYNYHSTNRADDWFFSPAINIPKDGKYLVRFETKGSSYSEQLELWIGSAPAAASMTDKVFDESLVLVDYQKYVLVDAKAGNLTLGFHATSNPDCYRLYLGNITVSYIENPADIAVTEILNPKSGEGLGSESVTATIANNGNNAISDFEMSYSVTVNGETTTIKEPVRLTTPLAAGASMQYTFARKVDLSTPRQAYTIAVTADIDGDINPDNNTLTTEVRHLAPAPLPYFMGFENSEDTSSISYLNLNNDDGTWHIAIDSWFTKFSRTGSASMCYNYSSANAANDWFFLDPFALDAGYYALKFWYSATENHPERLRVCWGTAPTPEAMTNVITEISPMTNVNYEESINIFNVPTSGRYYIGFYAFSDANENWLCLDDISFEAVDANAADLEVLSFEQPFDYWRAPYSTDAVVTVRNTGVVDANADVVLFIDGNEAKRMNQTFTAMKVQTVTLAEAIKGLQAGNHTVEIKVEYAADTKLDNNTATKDIVVLPTQPQAIWDFENCPNTGSESDPFYAIPSDLTYRVEDYYTVHPEAGAEYDDNGFGIFSLQHPALGQRALATCTWFTSSGSADRWIVLPPFTVSGQNAWFAWDAMSFNPNYLESYRVKVSDGNDHWSDYNTEASIDNETISPKTRGISLGKYAGKTIHIAINVTTYNGEALVLDNLGVYGQDIAGINDVTVDNGNNNAPVQIYNLQGIELDNDNVPAGIYIRRQGDKTEKVIVR